MPPAAARTRTLERRAALFEEAVRLIDAEYRSSVALDELARRIGTSRRQLQRAFAEAGETSFRSYLQRARLEKAAELLVEGRLPVGQIAAEVGYRHAAQFSKAFREHYGVSPSTYARRHFAFGFVLGGWSR